MQQHHKRHRPMHHLDEKGMYFVTVSTYLQKPLFDDDAKKSMLRKVLKEKADACGAKIFAYVLLDSHYHMLITLKKDSDLAELIHNINGKSAFLLNNIDQVKNRKVWHNYWDTCIRREVDFWKRFNYIHQNPVKHKYVDVMDGYRFSSYRAWVRKMGIGWLNDAFEIYPIKDFVEKGDD